MTPEALAALHARCFDAAPRPWSAAEFAAMRADPAHLWAFAAEGFALGRVAGPEAELLTLAVAPEARRRGTGARLVGAYEAAAAAAGAAESLLEVAATNAAARALYARLGYVAVGLRRGYYRPASGPPMDALVMRKALQPSRENAQAR